MLAATLDHSSVAGQVSDSGLEDPIGKKGRGHTSLGCDVSWNP